MNRRKEFRVLRHEEAFGEKIRALAERARPRDLYDVINLFRNNEARPTAAVLLDVLGQKCAFKGIDVPAFAGLEPQRSLLEGNWDQMLAHQLPNLPPFAAFWDELPVFFDWLRGGFAPSIPAAYIGAPGERTLRERTMRLPLAGRAQSYLEVIRFAASNRLCVDLRYQGSTRRIEPYSLRRTKEGNIILHAHNRDSDEPRSYRVDRIEGSNVTGETFNPRFAIELTPAGPLGIAPTRRGESSAAERIGPTTSRMTRVRSRGIRRRSGAAMPGGPTYVYKCSFCGKRLSRKKPSYSLNPHKNKNGFPCAGRHAVLVKTRF